MLRLNYLLCIALVASLVALTSCPGGKPGAGGGHPGGGAGAMAGPPPVAVMLEPVQMRDYAPAVDLIGDIRAAKQATLSAEVSGKVVAINKRLGESWTASNAPLLQIDPATYNAALKGAKAQLAQAKQSLERVQNGPRSEEIAAQEAQVASAMAMQRQALDNYSRQQKLFKEGAVAEQVVVVAKAGADSAQAGVDGANEVLSALKTGSRSEDLGVAQAAVDAAESQVDAAKLNLARASITPAFNCDVAHLFVEVGSFVGPGTPLVEVVSSGALEAWLNLPEAEAAAVNTGDTIEIRADSLPGKVFEATVLSVAPMAAPGTRQFAVRASVEGAGLKPGIAIDGRLLKGEPQQMTFISADATVMGQLGLVAYIMTPPAAEGDLPGVQMMPIKTGEVLDGMVVVLESELAPGMMVVTQGIQQLHPGAKIIPANMGMGGPGGPPGGGMPGAGGAPDDGSGAANPHGASGGAMPEAGGANPHGAPVGGMPEAGGANPHGAPESEGTGGA